MSCVHKLIFGLRNAKEVFDVMHAHIEKTNARQPVSFV